MTFDAGPVSILRNDCTLCPVQNCICSNRSTRTAHEWLRIPGVSRAVIPGAALFEAGMDMLALYAVRGGCMKTYTLDSHGKEHIRGFHLPGDVIGLDALGGSCTRATAAAVVRSQVCAMPVADIRGLFRSDPAAAMQLSVLASRELALALSLCGDFTAQQRLAAFLLHMEDRLAAHGGVLKLPMSHREIGSYLRMANETVTRTLKVFEGRHWLSRSRQSIRLLARHDLYQVAEPVGICRRPALQIGLAA